MPSATLPTPIVIDSEPSFSAPPALRERSSSAPTSPVTPPWTPPRRRRIASAEPASSCWLDVHFVVDVVKDADGCRELHCYLQAGEHTAHVAITLRRLLFWLVVLLLCLPTGAFQLTPPSIAGRAPTIGSASLTALARLGRLDNTVSTMQTAPELNLFESVLPLEHSAEHLLPLEHSAEHLAEEFDQCILDASSDDDFAACLQQMHTSSLDELSGVIVKEGCNLLEAADDGTAVSLLANALQTVREEGLEALGMERMRRMAVRACVSATLHKITVCALPAVSACMLSIAPNAVHTFSSLLN